MTKLSTVYHQQDSRHTTNRLLVGAVCELLSDEDEDVFDVEDPNNTILAHFERDP